MGNYQAYNIVLDPERREPETVARELAAALPEAYEAADDVNADLEDVIYDRTPKRYGTRAGSSIGMPRGGRRVNTLSMEHRY